MVRQSNLIGDETVVKERIAAYRNAGVTTLRVTPIGQKHAGSSRYAGPCYRPDRRLII